MSRIQYHNTSAAHNVTTSATLLSGDVHPNPGPATTTQDRTKLSRLRTLYLNAHSLNALVDSPKDDNSQKISKLTIFQNLVYLNQYDIVCVCETWLNDLILDNEILPGYTIHRLRAVPPFRGFRFPGMRKERKGGTADNTSRNEIRVAHTTQNSHWSKSIRLSIKSDM